MFLTKEKVQILNAVFARISKDDCIVFLFGSHATGETVRGSDVDIGILSRSAISAKDFVEIEEDVNNNTAGLKKIDLVDFSTVSKKIRQEALKEIKIWHEGKNCGTFEKFEAGLNKLTEAVSKDFETKYDNDVLVEIVTKRFEYTFETM